MSVNLNLVSFTPTDAAATQDVLKNGDVGQIQNRVLDGETLTITTEKGKFVFNAPGLQDPEAVTPQDMQDALTSVNQLAKEGNDTLADIYSIMSLFHELASTQRSSAREARFASRDLQMGELGKQVEELKNAAMMAMAMGIVSGALQIAGGAMQIGFAASAANSLKSGTDLAKTAATTAEKATADGVLKGVDIALQRAQGWSGIFSGMGGIANSVGQGVSGDMNAEATRHQSEATKADAAAQEEQDFMNSMRDLIHDVQEKLQAIIQSEADTMKTILRA